jgi:hypothetical protein
MATLKAPNNTAGRRATERKLEALKREAAEQGEQVSAISEMTVAAYLEDWVGDDALRDDRGPTPLNSGPAPVGRHSTSSRESTASSWRRSARQMLIGSSPPC